MKIVFFGTSEFAVSSLKKLAETKHHLLLVVTQPDRKKGRHLHLNQSPVKIEAGKLEIPIYQPENASRPEPVGLLRKQRADLFVVVAFGQILGSQLLRLPLFYSINLHASLLPKYRGAAPASWAIIRGEKESGVSIIKLTEKMDAGDVILSKKSKISPDDTGLTLNKKLSGLGAELLLEAVDLIEKRKAKFARQDEKLLSYAPKLKKGDGLIDWKRPAVELHNLVRGLIPWPTAFTYWKGKLIKIYKTGIDKRDFEYSAGQIASLDEAGIIVKTGKESLIIKELQLEGGKRLDPGAFLRGHKMKVGDRLG